MIKFVKLTKWLKPTLILAVTFTALWAYSISAQIEDLEDLKGTTEQTRENEVQNENTANLEEFKREIEQKNEEIKKLEEEAQKYRQEISSKQEMGKNLKDELKRIEKNIKQLKNDIYLTGKKIQKTEAEIKKTLLEIDQRETAVQKLRQGLAGLVQTVFEKDLLSTLAVFLQHNFISEFFRQLDYNNALEKNIFSALDSLRALQKELETQKMAAEKKKKELTVLQKSFSGRKNLQEETKKAQNSLLLETKNQEKKYQELLLEQEKKRAALEDEIREIEAKLDIAVDLSSLPRKGVGVLGWPLPELSLSSCFKGFNEFKNCITQFFGYTSFATVGGYNGKGHNGVDFRAAPGTQVLAAEGGVIDNTGDTDIGCRKASYGKWILVRHSNNLSSIYAHLANIGVYSGQEIKRGDYLGLSGATGYATGPHLHFGVFVTQAVKIESIRSRVCGRMMTLPIAPREGYLNPLDYL